jgi:hypothetical protein
VRRGRKDHANRFFTWLDATFPILTFTDLQPPRQNITTSCISVVAAHGNLAAASNTAETIPLRELHQLLISPRHDRTHLCRFQTHTSDLESIKRDTPARRVSTNESRVRILESAQTGPERVVIRLLPCLSSCPHLIGIPRPFSSVQARSQQDAPPGRLESAVRSESTSHAGF